MEFKASEIREVNFLMMLKNLRIILKQIKKELILLKIITFKKKIFICLDKTIVLI